MNNLKDEHFVSNTSIFCKHKICIGATTTISLCNIKIKYAFKSNPRIIQEPKYTVSRFILIFMMMIQDNIIGKYIFES